MQNNTYTGDEFLETEDVLETFCQNLKLAPNPIPDQREKEKEIGAFLTMQVPFGIENIRAATAVLEAKNVNRALITANGMTIGIRKFNGRWEIFDSHGDQSTNNAAYIRRFANINNLNTFLDTKFINISFSPLFNINITPLTLQ